jgi:hypothetical protein
MHWVVEKFCCAALPEVFGVLNAPQPSSQFMANPASGAYTYRYSAQSARSAINFTTGIKGTTLAAVGKLSGSGKFMTSYASAPKIPPAIAVTSGIQSGDLVGQNVDAARAKLNASKITVDTVLPYDKTQLAANISHYATVPENLKPGSAVTLVANEQGVVQYYMLSSPPPATQALNTALSQIATLQTTLANVQATSQRDLAARDLLIQNLQVQVAKISAHVNLLG